MVNLFRKLFSRPLLAEDQVIAPGTPAAFNFRPRKPSKVTVADVMDDSEAIAANIEAYANAMPSENDQHGPFGKSISVDTIKDFATLPLLFEDLVNDFQLGSHLGYNVQPALFGGVTGSDAARIAILVNPLYAHSDEVVELLTILSNPKQQQHKQTDDNPPSRSEPARSP